MKPRIDRRAAELEKREQCFAASDTNIRKAGKLSCLYWHFGHLFLAWIPHRAVHPMSTPTNLRLSAEGSATPDWLKSASRDPRALRILAKTIYRELRTGGLAEEDVMALAGELLSLVTCDVKDRRRSQTDTGEHPAPATPRPEAPKPPINAR
jgi:hypothetical protein